MANTISVKPDAPEIPRGTGLQPLPPDERDFSHEQVFGAAKLDDLPDEYLVGDPLGIKDQGNTDFCAGFAAAAVSEDQEAVKLNGPFSFMAAKKLLGGDAWKSWGLNLRDVCRGGTKIGFLEEDSFPFKDDDRAGDRDFLANPENWPEDSFVLAEDHKKETFFAVDGPYDTFDNIRSTMYRARAEERSVITGCLFRKSWLTPSLKGIIDGLEYEPYGEGHAFKVLGWMQIKGEPMLVVVNSWGEDVGDKGIFYFNREVVNKEFTYGSYTFRDMPREKAEYFIENGIKPGDPLLLKLLKVIAAWIIRSLK